MRIDSYVNQGSMLISKNVILKPTEESWINSTSRREITQNKNTMFLKPISINELIGEQLAKKMNLRTVNYYFIENYAKEISLCSYNFKNHDKYEYSRTDSIKLRFKTKSRYIDFCSNINYFSAICIDDSNRREFLSKLFKLVALDTYMRQTDRVHCNLLLEISKENDYLDFAPIYDYNDSFAEVKTKEQEEYIKNFYSYNPILPLGIDEYGYTMGEYSELRKELTNIKNLSMSQVLDDICREKQIIIADKQRDYYLKQEKLSQKILEKILN